MLLSAAWASTQMLSASTRLDEVKARLEASPVQEKVYVHLDNNCYFLGDTIWYKTYVVRADNHRYSDMSRLVYVELVTPDGMVVERQNLIASEQGYGDGNFVLSDSLYSGYYELRAYTRWMLNFCVSQHPHQRYDIERFYNAGIGQDFFREYGIINSRVVPVYEKPENEGEYGYRFMRERPKRRVPEPPKENLCVSFYPEGGQIVADVPCHVAFEAVDQSGKAVYIEGTLVTAEGTRQIATTYQGRGEFVLTAAGRKAASATFRYHDKDYTFDLPKPVTDGCAIHVSQNDGKIQTRLKVSGLPASDTLGVAVLCRGQLQHFQTLAPSLTADYQLEIEGASLPTGVNDIIVFDAQGQPLADRLFFVNHHDMESLASVAGMTAEIAPLQQVTLQLQAPSDARHLSVSVRDHKTDETTFDTGSMLTDLLLSSDLKGFVANPDFYFVDDSPMRLAALDLLMMVQGWRRYDYRDLVSDQPLRYQPETCMSVAGRVYKTIDFVDAGTRISEQMFDADRVQMGFNDSLSMPYARSPWNHPKPLKKEVMVNAELVLVDEIGELNVVTWDSGHFEFNFPAYFGNAVLSLNARNVTRGEKKRDKKERLDENAWPDYYVKRDLFYPIFAKPYNYYQCHLPDVQGQADEDYRFWLEDASAKVRISSMDAVLDNVDVKALIRKGSRVIDLRHPVFTMDAYDLYNLACDYGLQSGKFNYYNFAEDIVTLLFGSYDNSGRSPVVQRRLNTDVDGEYSPDDDIYLGNETMTYQSSYTHINGAQLKRMDEVRVYSDFDLRNFDHYIERSQEQWDALVKFVLLPGESTRHTFRDRHIMLPGIYMPADFYHPDYSQRPLPADQTDYRRTLYWNPNLMLDADGHCTITFYNNSSARNLHISVAGLTSDGRPVTLEE